MNESTLVPREEMSDLDWLARNVHEWNYDGQNYCYVMTIRNGKKELSASAYSQFFSKFTKDQWLARRTELQNKPSWEDAPAWAEWLAQDVDGEWFWYKGKPVARENTFHSGKCSSASYGLVIGDWRDTLEKRPADLSEQAVTARLKEATDNVLASTTELITDKYKFDPFVSVEDAGFSMLQSDCVVKDSGGLIDRFILVKEDAATAKQPLPKGIGSPILGMVLADLTNRALEGKEKYGEPLLAHNGRNPLWDAYQEALDLAMYLRQAIEEQK